MKLRQHHGWLYYLLMDIFAILQFTALNKIATSMDPHNLLSHLTVT